MENKELCAVLTSILQMMREQAIYLHRQHGWMIAVAETVKENPEAKIALERHPFYDQGPRRDVDTTDQILRNIESLIQRLKA